MAQFSGRVLRAHRYLEQHALESRHHARRRLIQFLKVSGHREGSAFASVAYASDLKVTFHSAWLATLIFFGDSRSLQSQRDEPRGGQFENQQRAHKRFALVIPISIAGIFILLFGSFGSVKLAILIILNIPFALIGGILALVLGGFILSVSASVGFIPQSKSCQEHKERRFETAGRASKAPLLVHV